MSLMNRYSAIDKAVIVAAGNSLTTCGSTDALNVNTSNLITLSGDFTRDWNIAGSTSPIHFLENSTILYAELIWYSTVRSFVPAAPDVQSIQDKPIVFTTPVSTENITPDTTQTLTASSGSINHLRTANVTSLIQTSLSGIYSVESIPTSIPPSGLSDSISGWSLIVVYRHESFNPKRIHLSIGIELISPSTPLQKNLIGFTTPAADQNLTGEVVFVCANGQPLVTGDQLKSGNSFAHLKQLGNVAGTGQANPGTAPNNPYNNIISGQINICDPIDTKNGLLNIAGTNGSNNHDAFLPTQLIHARNKWDLSSMNLKNTLLPTQTQVSIQYTNPSSDASVQWLAMGMQVAAIAPDITATLVGYDIDDSDPYNDAEVDEHFTFGIQIRNTGLTSAQNVTLTSPLDPSVSFIPDSIKVNGITQVGADITKGINIGTLEPAGVANILYEVHIDEMPADGLFKNFATYTYEFLSGTGSPTYSNTATTNTITVTILDACLQATQSVSTNKAAVGDTLTYHTTIQNTGTQDAVEIFFQDTLNPYIKFVANSIYIDEVNHPNLSPVTGFSLTDLAPNESITVTFDVIVTGISPTAYVTNTAYTTFSYTYNQHSNNYRKTIASNTSEFQVTYTNIVAIREANNYYPSIGDKVTYTLSLTNIGNISAADIGIREPEIYGCIFVEGSVSINNDPKPSLNPFTGFELSNPIAPQATTTITYQVLVEAFLPDGIIKNIAQIPFKYQIQSTEPTIEDEEFSNTVITHTNFVTIEIIEEVDKAFATIDDILYYSVTIQNKGNIDAFNTIFSSNIEPDTTFIPNSVTINGMPQSDSNPNDGFSVGTIAPDSYVTVTYQVRVHTLPNPNSIYNYSELIYDYKPDPTATHITHTALSNTVQTIINVSSLSVVKTVDQNYAQVDDYLVYTTFITNTGTVPIENIYFSDNLMNSLEFYSDSVYIDGTNYPKYNPVTGFSIGSLDPTETYKIAFAAKIKTPPEIGYISNTSLIISSSKLTPNDPVLTTYIYSNTVTTQVLSGNMTISKHVNKDYATLGDTLTYSFEVANTGTTSVNNVFFIDTLPSGCTFVAESVKINTFSKPSLNPDNGFSLSTLHVGEVVTISFDVTITDVPNPNTLMNRGRVSFDYLWNPDFPPITKTITSNEVTTIINASTVHIAKQVDKTYATVDDVLTYTIIINNSGTVPLTNVVFSDFIPEGIRFIESSVLIDDIDYPDYNPNNSFPLKTITVGGSCVVIFKAIVTNIPSPPQVDNTATISYQYQLSPSSSFITDTATSNTATTFIRQINVSNIKQVNKTYATINDELIYTSTITNNGDINIHDVYFTDSTPIGTQFINGSVSINGINKPSLSPQTGFSLDTILPNQTIVVTFKVIVDTLPTSSQCQNTSRILFNYQISDTSPVLIATIPSNTVTTFIRLASMTVTKIANREEAKVFDTLTYTLFIKNTGNVTLSSLSLQDILQSESTFNIGSVYINDVQYSNYNPNTGFLLGTLHPAQSVTVRFDATITQIPAAPSILYNNATVSYDYYIDPGQPELHDSLTSNTTEVLVKEMILSAVKTVDKSIAKIGDTLTFTTTLDNQGSVDATNIIFTDVLDSHLHFNTGSVYINGIQYSNYNPNNGFTLPDISSTSDVVITFKATILSSPLNNTIYNTASLHYQFIIDTQTYTIDTNTNTTKTQVATSSLDIVKYVDKTYATTNDTLIYSFAIQNTGSVDATNLVFLDDIPASTVFVPGSVIINNIPQTTFNPVTGFPLDNLAPLQGHVVSFAVTIYSLPETSQLNNTGSITFNYQLTPSDPIGTTTINSNTVTTFVHLGRLELVKSVDKEYATLGDTLTYQLALTNTGNVTCSSIYFRDLIEQTASFDLGSVRINGIPKPNFNPNTGFTLEPMDGEEMTTITFTATLKETLSKDLISNTGSVNYQYYIDPDATVITDSTTSNTVTTHIHVGIIGATKSVNMGYATLDDIIIYTITLINEGNVPTTTVNFRDVIPTGLTFIQDSVIIDGLSKPGFNPYESFTVGTIMPGNSVTIRFSNTVTSIETPSSITNFATITYAYQITPSDPEIIKEVQTNEVTTKLNLGKLSIIKAVDKGYATSGDKLTYSFVITNTGNVDVSNIRFTDGVDENIYFNSGSVVINDTPSPSFDPTIGFNLGSLSTLEEITLSFTVTLTEDFTHSAVLNHSIVNFDYKVDPNGEWLTKSTPSNTVSTLVILPRLDAKKVVNLTYATLLDTLTYTIMLTNSGNTDIYDIDFVDTLSDGATFEEDSVTIDEVAHPELNPISGFSLPLLAAGEVTSIEFKVNVTSVPTPPQVTNFAVATGLYKIDPQGTDFTLSSTTNSVATQINVGNISNAKSVDKSYAKIGDNLTYTSILTNVGNVNATNIWFFDTLQSELEFIPGSVRINGITDSTYNPINGFNIGTLFPTQSVTISFDVKIKVLPTPPHIDNRSQVEFSYKMNPEAPALTETNFSNTVTTEVVNGEVTLKKSTDKTIATIGDEISYTIQLVNVGNVIIKDTFFQDIPSEGVSFQPRSVKINHATKPTFDPTIGFTLDEIAVGNTVTITFVVIVDSVPDSDRVQNQAALNFKYLVNPDEPAINKTQYSNIVTTTIALGDLSVVKSVDKAFATIDDYLTYTVVITNIGNIDATNVIFLDQTPDNSEFVVGSVVVNGKAESSYHPAIGFTIGTMTQGQIVTVVYKVQVTQ